MIIFENPGELDPRLITTIGVNVKPQSSNPIGFFGTGLKYAIATCLREQASICIQSGLTEFTFAAQTETIRGKEFQLISMFGAAGPPLELAFTTELGRQWQPWMVLRELWSNAKDETAYSAVEFAYETSAKPRPEAGTTRVIVDGPQLQHAWDQRDAWLLSTAPLSVLEGVELHPGPGRGIFYQGIRVLELAVAKPSHYTYNIIERLHLSEDRTAQVWDVNSKLCRAFKGSSNRAVLARVISPGGSSFEASLDYDYIWGEPSPQWLEEAGKAARANPLAVHESIRKLVLPAEEIKCCPTCKRPL